jgi:predicted dienelactone hydrolase
VLAPDHNEHLDPDDQLWRSAISRPKDVQGILAYLDQSSRQGDSLAGMINIENVAVVGHSYGGYTALASAGARFDTGSFRSTCASVQGTDEPGAWLCERLSPHVEDMADMAGLAAVPEGLWPAQATERVDAIVPMAGDALFYGQPGLSEITVPVLAIGGTADEDSPFVWGTQPSYTFTSSNRKMMIGLIGAEHMIFTGPCEKIPWHLKLFSGEFCADRSWDRTYAHAITKHFVTAFLLVELKDDGDAISGILINETEIPGLNYQVFGY